MRLPRTPVNKHPAPWGNLQTGGVYASVRGRYNDGQRDRLPWRGIMRRIIVVLWGFVFASVLVSLGALSAGAQTAAPQEPAYEGPSQG